jgi:hypothetical protein
MSDDVVWGPKVPLAKGAIEMSERSTQSAYDVMMELAKERARATRQDVNLCFDEIFSTHDSLRRRYALELAAENGSMVSGPSLQVAQGTPVEVVYDTIAALARERARQSSLTFEKAFDKVLSERADLRAEYQKALRLEDALKKIERDEITKALAKLDQKEKK